MYNNVVEGDGEESDDLINVANGRRSSLKRHVVPCRKERRGVLLQKVIAHHFVGLKKVALTNRLENSSQQDDHKIGSMLPPGEGEVEVDEQWWHEWESGEGAEGLPLAEGSAPQRRCYALGAMNSYGEEGTCDVLAIGVPL
ncbi:hypothetical protein GW17_00032378 [Ensete ventricosum]|nr:hypothetical protein GW17_00032378 [Ensete ventricosum]